MYNCWNEAVGYLIKKNGAKETASRTSCSKIYTYNPSTDGEGKRVEILLSQYHFGIQAKKELFNYLQGIGAIGKRIKGIDT